MPPSFPGLAEVAGRLQLALMMDEQLAQTQSIEALRRQVETSSNAARDAQALLRATQEQLPLVQRFMNTVEKTSTGVTPADLILSHSIRLTSHIMSPVDSCIDSSDISLSDRMDEWVSRQHTLLVVAQETHLQSDQHKVVENDAEITNYPINSYGHIHLHQVVVTSYFPNIEDHIKLEDGSSPYTSSKI